MKNGGTGNAMCKIGGLYVKCENSNNITRNATNIHYYCPDSSFITSRFHFRAINTVCHPCEHVIRRLRYDWVTNKVKASKPLI